MPEMPYPARPEKEISGFAQTEVRVCEMLVFVFSFCLDLFLCFCPHTVTFVNVMRTMT